MTPGEDRGAAALLGAWRLDGGAIDPARLAAIRARDGGPGAAEALLGPLWLRACVGRLAQGGGTIAAYEGFVPDGAAGWAALREELGRAPRRAPLGHGAFVWSRPEACDLRLLCDPMGAEHLYFALDGGLLLFSASLRALIAARGGRAAVGSRGVLRFLLGREMALSSDTLVAGISQVPPGRMLVARGRRLAIEPIRDPTREPAQGPPARPASLLRGAVGAAVARCATGAAPVAVALSGGLDSAFIADLAVEAFGARRVQAFTYEFEAEGFREAEHAAAVCRRLGIRHQIVRIGFEDYLRSLPEVLARSEWPGQFWLAPGLAVLSRSAGACGFSTMLTGQGMEYVLGILQNAPAIRLLARLPRWRLLSSALPMDFRFAAGCILRHNGLEPAWRDFFPGVAADAACRLAGAPEAARFVRELQALPLECQLRHAYFHAHASPRMLRLAQKAGRRSGAALVAPALLPGPAALGEPFQLFTRGREAAGRAVQIEAMRGRIPDPVLGRGKVPGQAVGPERWKQEARRLFEPHLRGELERLDAALGPDGKRLREAVSPGDRDWLGLWHWLFVGEGASVNPAAEGALSALFPEQRGSRSR